MSNRVMLSLFLLVLCCVPAQAQTVSTLIPGPSLFDDALSLAADGTLYASYYYGARVSKITSGGSVSLVASGLQNPNGSTVDAEGNLYVAIATGNRVDKITPAGVKTVFVSGVTNPAGLVFDLNGDLLIAQYQLNRITRRNSQGALTTMMSGSPLNGPVGMQIDATGNLYVGNFNDGKVLKRTPAGVVTQIGDVPGWLGFIALAGDDIYAAGFQVHRIYRMGTDGSGQSIFAGTGSAGQADGDVLSATFNGPNGIVASPSGDTLYITDHNARSLRVITGLGSVSAESTSLGELKKRFGDRR